MNKLTKIIFASAIIFSPSAHAFDLTSLFKQPTTGDTQTSQEKQIGNTSSEGLGSLLGGLFSATPDSTSSSTSGLGSLLNNLIPKKEVDASALVGTWNYQSPAVSFVTDNTLQNIGGAAASVAIEEKLSPYYEKIGLNNMVLVVNEDHTFSLQLMRMTLSGVIEDSENEGQLILQFTALNSINLGKYITYVSLTGNNLSLTFDVSKLKLILNKVAGFSKNSTVGTVNSILQSYDGIRAGFKLIKQ